MNNALLVLSASYSIIAFVELAIHFRYCTLAHRRRRRRLMVALAVIHAAISMTYFFEATTSAVAHEKPTVPARAVTPRY